MDPIYAHGKICYLEIPSLDIAQSSAFFHKLFGWNIRTRGDGSVSFDDPVGCVSGTWVLGRPAFAGDSLTVHIMVDDAVETLRQVVAEGGTVIEPASGGQEVMAKFRDPAGNVFGIYQERALLSS